MNIDKIYEATLKTPGELRLLNKDILVTAVSKGVENGIFGFGELIDNEIKCLYFKEKQFITLTDNSIIIKPEICETQKLEIDTEKPYEREKEKEPIVSEEGKVKQGEIGFDIKKDNVHLTFSIPKGKVSGIMGILNLLQLKFEDVKIEISATDGEISESDYENKIKEALIQLGIDI
ncbi:MAG: hypothetical protein H8D45_21860 [Bacteroidetes bacterium]|nr:hypothetical protein [Bacteroidota bacterium]